jgi:hypothetical protein
MKKIVLLLALVLTFANNSYAQSVGASQIKKKTQGGLVGDTANALTVAIHRGTTSPTGPLVSGQLWLDTSTTPATPKTYNGTAWDVMPMGGALVVASLADLPASPGDGRLAWVTSMRRSVVYDATSGDWYYLGGQKAKAVGTYSLEVAGLSSAFLPAAGATTGSVAAGGSVTLGTHICAVSYYNADGGETMAGTPTSTLTATSGQQTLALSFAASVTGSAGKRVWCSKANTVNPLFYVTTIHDTTTDAYNVTVVDTSFWPSTSPDVDFSAPIPAGWSVWIPAPHYGGCGSTGTELLCSSYLVIASSGTTDTVKLTYAIDPEMEGYRVRARITRAANGFAGSIGTSVNSSVLGYFTTDDPTVVATESRGIGPDSGLGSACLPYGTCPPTKHWRGVGGSWTRSSTQTSMSIENSSVATLPHWAEQITYWDGSTWDTRWGLSVGGRDFSYWTAEALTWNPRYVGITAARPSTTSTSLTAAVVALDSLTVEPY